jgi:hypothetical protein
MHRNDEAVNQLCWPASSRTVIGHFVAVWDMQKSEQTGTGFQSKAAGDFGGKRHLISLQSGT